MTTSKLIDNNRRSHAAKVLAKASQKNQSHESHETGEAQASADTTKATRSEIMNTLNDQYSVIREDILKLREDLAHGYDIIKEVIDTKLSIRSLLRTK